MISMPMCCCTFRALGTCCGDSEQNPSVAQAATQSSESDASEQHIVDAPNHGHCHGGHCHAAPDVGTTNSQPTHGSDKPCDCGKSHTKMGLVNYQVPEVPAPALVAILPELNFERGAVMSAHIVRMWAMKPESPPSTALLQLHCALTV